MASKARFIGTSMAFFLALLFVASPVVAEKVNIRGMRYLHYTMKSDEAYQRKDWETAIRYREYLADLVPFDQFNYYNLACCYALDGQRDKAFEALANSIQYGWCDSAHISKDSDLDSLRDDDRYKAMIESSKECDTETRFVYKPDSAGNAKTDTVLVALCGYGGSPRSFAYEWVPTADQLGIPVISLKGRGATRSEGVYGWHKGMNPRDLDVEGAAKLIDDALAAEGLKPSQAVIVGFSQGGAVALELMAEYPDKYRGTVTIAGGNDVAVFRKWIANAEEAKPRVYMIAGVLDGNRPFGERVMEPIVDAGIKFKYNLLPLCGHELPANATDLYVEAIEFLTEDG